MLSRQSHGKRKDEEKLPQTKNVATVDDFEEAREVMSGENSNLPVKRSSANPFKASIGMEEVIKFATSKLDRV